jgi:hypothetical protein
MEGFVFMEFAFNGNRLLVIADIISKRGQEAKSMTLGELADILRYVLQFKQISRPFLYSFFLFQLPKPPLLRGKNRYPYILSFTICSSTKCEVCLIALNHALSFLNLTMLSLSNLNESFSNFVFLLIFQRKKKHMRRLKDEAEVQVVPLLIIWRCFVV